jgi:outer membrane protein assembly factor BamE (lipoprotein component of BamABCDE complex)
MTRTTIGFLMAIVTLIAGCAGTNFVRPQPDALVLGKTTYQEVLRQFGEPYRKGTAVQEGLSVTTIAYSYSSATAGTGLGGITPGRTIAFSFVNDVLVGYDFISSYEADSTDFDETKLGQIEKGRTTRAQVEALLGRPGGMYAYPLIKNKSEQALVYSYLKMTSGPFSVDMYQKKLVVVLDSNGVVTDVAFSTSGEK